MKELKDMIRFINDRPVFEKYLNRCMQDDKPTQQELTYTVLRELWQEEMVADKYIAAIFDTSIETVRGLREQYGLNHKSCVQELMDKCAGILGATGSAIMMV